ncbi:MAG: 3-dehydroquinate synthase [Gammaproteobacteria bacterium AqS3]|nr:3-dehydroquinate synthase [Gammaproteobacteria bacterium AqS3]
MRVRASGGEYPIYIGSGLLGEADYLLPHLGAQALLVADAAVADFAGAIERACSGRGQFGRLLLPSPVAKTAASLERIYTRLIEGGYSRDCTLIALGGGSAGDLVGYAAATYQRGVDFIQAPTTLLGQVDASVGGKTAIDHPLGKNLIGAFHQPRAVLIDLATLDSLPERELRAGLAEVLKYGLIADADGFFDWVQGRARDLLGRDPGALAEAVRRSCGIKAEIVQADEREQTGARALLNLGHTFGHAIEAWQGYGDWNHGEAVAAGLVMAADFSWRSGRLGLDDAVRIRGAVEALGLPSAPPAGMQPEDFLRLMGRDKKNRAGVLRLIVLNGIGRAELIADPDPDLLHQTLAAGGGLARG